MKKLIYKVLLAGVLIPLSACFSNPTINDQYNSGQANLGPIFNAINAINAINNSHQDGSRPFKPFQGLFSTSAGQQYYNQQNANIQGRTNVQSNYQQNQVPVQKQTPPPPVASSPVTPPLVTTPHVTPPPKQPNYVSVVQPPKSQMKQPPQPLQPTISLQQALGQAGAMPVILQYLPQGHMPGSVQYIQLIPTRPLIGAINPYLGEIPNYQFNQKNGQTSCQHKANSINDQIPAASRTSPGSIIGGYVDNSPSFRYFRPNSGMEVINPPPDLSLNMNEYFPAAVANLNKISSSGRL